MKDHDLWTRIEAMVLDDPDGDLPYSVKLAEAQRWTPEHTSAVIEEYKRFIYLAMIDASETTPSPDIDEAWHLHLTYTKHYWGEMCDRILKRPFHHVPCSNRADMSRYHSQYEATKRLYRQEFDADPPRDVWPAADAASKAQAGHWIFNTGLIASIGSIFMLIPSGDRIWWIASAVSLAVLAVGWFLEKRHAAKGRQAKGDASGAGCGDGDGSGCGSCGGD